MAAIDLIENWLSGKKTNLKTVAKIFAKKLGKEVTFKSNYPTSLIANISKLNRLGFKQKLLNLRRYLN